MLKPFSDNIIFFDTEFSDLDPVLGEILSIGMVKPTGEELYIEFEFNGKVSEWVKGNVLQLLDGRKGSKEEARREITNFVGNSSPYLVSCVSQFDAIYWYKIFGFEKSQNPAYWFPIDFASMLFAYGLHPESYKDQVFLERIGVDPSKYRKHHALDDARLLKDTYLKFLEKSGGIRTTFDDCS